MISLTKYWFETKEMLLVTDTVIENLQEGIFRRDTIPVHVYQELYGVSVLATIRRGMESINLNDDVVYTDLIATNDAKTGDSAGTIQRFAKRLLQFPYLDDEHAWKSNRIVKLCEFCLKLSFRHTDEKLRDVGLHIMGLLEDVGSCMLTGLKYSEDIFGCVKRGIGLGETTELAKNMTLTGEEVQKICLYGGMLARLTHKVYLSHKESCSESTASGIPMLQEFSLEALDLVAKALEYLNSVPAKKWQNTFDTYQHQLVLIAAALVEFIIPTSKRSHHGAITSSLLKSGLYRSLIQRFLRQQNSDNDFILLARSILLCGCFSSELRDWALRVPGYTASWQGMGESSELEKQLLFSSWKGIILRSEAFLDLQEVVEALTTCISTPTSASMSDLTNILRSLHLIAASLANGHVKFLTSETTISTLKHFCSSLQATRRDILASTSRADRSNAVENQTSATRERSHQPGKKNDDANGNFLDTKMEDPSFNGTIAFPASSQLPEQHLVATLLKCHTTLKSIIMLISPSTGVSCRSVLHHD